MTKTQRNIISLTFGFLAIVFLFSLQGCIAAKPAVSSGKDPLPREPEKEYSNYYHYTLSQLHSKRGKFNSAAKHLKEAIKLDPESYFLKKELAVLYLKARKPENALREVRKLILEKPDDVETLIMFGRMCQILKTKDDITSVYEKVIRIDPERKQIYLLLGRLYQDQGRTEEALKVYTSFTQKYPDSYIGHYYRGHVNLILERLDSAESSLKKSLVLNPALNEARFDLIALEKIRNNADEVMRIYEKIHVVDPSNTRAGLNLALIHLKSGDTEKSNQILKDIVAAKVPEKEILTLLIQEFIEYKNYDDALIILLQLLKLTPHNPAYHYLAGICCSALEKPEQALDHFSSIEEKAEYYQKASIQTALIHNELQGASKAISFLEKRLESEPENLDFIFYIGQFHEDLEQLEKAEFYFKKGLKLEPNTPKLLFRLGAVYDKWGRKDDSIRELKKVIQLEPDNANALNYIGYSYAEQGKNLDEAEALIKKALTIRPNDGYITDSLGWVYYKKGQFQKAVETLEKAAILVPNDPILLEHLGDAYHKSSNKTKALTTYKRALKLKKSDTETLEKKIDRLSQEK